MITQSNEPCPRNEIYHSTDHAYCAVSSVCASHNLAAISCGDLSHVVKGQFSPQVLVLAACLPYFSTLIAGKHLQHLFQMDRGGCQQGDAYRHKQLQACLSVATHLSQPAWKQINLQPCVKIQPDY